MYLTKIFPTILQRIRNNDVTLTMIDLSYKRIGASGAQALAEAFKTNYTVITIRLGGNNIGDVGAQALAEVLKENQTVTTMELDGNNIGYVGAQALAEALKKNQTVTTIALNSNNIRSVGLEVLAESLKENQTVTTISLNKNQIGSVGLEVLAEVLKNNQTVTSIQLQRNEIGNYGTKALAEALKVNRTVTTIDLRVNRIEYAGAEALAEVLKTNQTLMWFYLAYNPIDVQLLQAIEDVMAHRIPQVEKLWQASVVGRLEEVEALIKQGVNLNYKNGSNETALDLAERNGHWNVVNLLLANTSNQFKFANVENNQGNTLLHRVVISAKENSLASVIIERLVALGAKRYIKNKSGQYPFQLCTQDAIPELLKPTVAEEKFLQVFESNDRVLLLLTKLSQDFYALQDLLVELRSNAEKKACYRLPGYLSVRLLFQELEMLCHHLEEDQLAGEANWSRKLKAIITAYAKLTDKYLATENPILHLLDTKESLEIEGLILALQQINQAVYKSMQQSLHTDAEITEIQIEQKWLSEYNLQSKNRDIGKCKREEIDDALPEAKRAKVEKTIVTSTTMFFTNTTQDIETTNGDIMDVDQDSTHQGSAAVVEKNVLIHPSCNAVKVK